MDASEAEEFAEVATKPLKALPYDTPGQTFVAFEKPEGVPAVGRFSNVLKFFVKEVILTLLFDFFFKETVVNHVLFGILQVDPSTGEVEEDGVEDEYQLEDSEIVAADYMLKVGVSNFRNAWESLGPDFERVDEYGLGPRESLSDAVSAVITLLGMQPCEVLLLLTSTRAFTSFPPKNYNFFLIYVIFRVRRWLRGTQDHTHACYRVYT